jgi:hypothetical protein
MFIARWIIEAKFGHKEEAMSLCKRWESEVGGRVGIKGRILTGSIGGRESRLEFESQFESLAALEKAWTEMAKLPFHKQFGKEIEPHVVSGSNRWEILRVVPA